MSILVGYQAASAALSQAMKTAWWPSAHAAAANQTTAAPTAAAEEGRSFALVIRYYSDSGYAKARTLGRPARFHPDSFQSGDGLIPEILRGARERNIDIASIIEARLTCRKGRRVVDLNWVPLGPSPEQWRWIQGSSCAHRYSRVDQGINRS